MTDSRGGEKQTGTGVLASGARGGGFPVKGAGVSSGTDGHAGKISSRPAVFHAEHSVSRERCRGPERNREGLGERRTAFAQEAAEVRREMCGFMSENRDAAAGAGPALCRNIPRGKTKPGPDCFILGRGICMGGCGCARGKPGQRLDGRTPGPGTSEESISGLS